MKINELLISELTLLSQFKSHSSFEGIKVHNDAAPELVSAANSLFDKDLITQSDGGYLTDLGKEALEHLTALHSILTTPAKLDTSF